MSKYNTVIKLLVMFYLRITNTEIHGSSKLNALYLQTYTFSIGEN